MLRFLIPAGLLAAPLLFSPQVSHAQTLGSSSCPCTLHGTVVNSVSGQPVNRALVRLTAPAPRATLTDSEGKFQFEGLPAGLVSVEAEKPGFLTEPVPGGPNVSFSIQLAPDSPPAILKIAPEGVIFGQVSDERGEPLEGFTITPLVRGPNNAQLSPYMPGRVQTDDEGKFRISELRPGSYYLVVRPPRGQGANSKTASSVPSGFPPHFYPGVNDSASASPIKIVPGKFVQANFSLKREPFIHLSGTVSGYSPREQVNLMILDSTGVPENLEIVFDQASGSFHTKWIPPGSYILTAQSMGAPVSDSPDAPSQPVLGLSTVRLRGASLHSFARLQVNAASNISDLHVVLQPTTDIPVILRGLNAAGFAGLHIRPFMLALLPKDPLPASPNHLASWNLRTRDRAAAGRQLLRRIRVVRLYRSTARKPGSRFLGFCSAYKCCASRRSGYPQWYSVVWRHAGTRSCCPPVPKTQGTNYLASRCERCLLHFWPRPGCLQGFCRR